MAGKNKKTESDFIKELEALEQQKREATEQLKAYLKSQTDKPRKSRYIYWWVSCWNTK